MYSRKHKKAAGSQSDARRDATSPFVMLPCQRCGQLSVSIPTFFLRGLGETFSCRSCEADHYFSISRKGNEYAICYQRYTLRYPIEDYDDGLEFPVVVMHASRRTAGEPDSESCGGPIVVYPRKSRFTRAEVKSIWQGSKGRCHLCNRRWPLDQRGKKGWHSFSTFQGTGERDKRRRAALLLASHLGVTDEKLENAIQNKLLVLARQWYWGNDFRSKWTEAAWPELQKDILLAVEWLCMLNGQTIDFYLDKWRYKHWGEGNWRELRKVLPFEWFSARDDFIKLSPMYLKTYNETFPGNPYTEESLKELVDRLRSTNYPFGSLLRAFRELHDALTYRTEDFRRLDVRDRRPLDYFLLLAIRVEAVLRYSLEVDGELSSMTDSELGLVGYITQRARKAGVSSAALDHFRKCERTYTKLKDTPAEPIAEVMRIKSPLSTQEHYLVQAFLCCVLARNYFAHHYYLDGTLLKSQESGFLLGGLLVTALKLA